MQKKLRVWHICQVGASPTFYVNVKDEAEAKVVLDTLGVYDMFQYTNRIKPDYCNTNGVEMWDEELQEWTDYYDEDGRDFNEYCEWNDIKTDVWETNKDNIKEV